MTVTTSSSDTEPGDISVNSPVIWGSHVLTLRADNNIIVNASLTSTGTTGSDGLILQYAQTTSSGTYTINSPINLAAGSLFQTQNGSSGPITYKIITDVSALQNMNADLSGRYALGSDIDASATRNWNSGAGFAPVGNSSNAFSGSFEGLGHVVSGLSINRPSENNVGLFGYANGAIIIGNVSLSNASIIGNNSVGALVGAANSTTINHADANGTIIGNDSVGGLLGYASYSLVTASFATGVVTGSGSRVGGLAGNVDNLSAVSDSYAEGRVRGASHVGGLIGYLGANSTATYVYSTSDVTGGAYVGGLVGYNDGAVVESYATGKLSGGSSADTGGLIGYNSASGTVDRSYWDIETTGVSTGCATNLGGCSATGLTTAAALLHQSYPGFSFWPAVPWGHWYGIHGYTRPFLRSEYSTIIRNSSASIDGDESQGQLRPCQQSRFRSPDRRQPLRYVGHEQPCGHRVFTGGLDRLQFLRNIRRRQSHDLRSRDQSPRQRTSWLVRHDKRQLDRECWLARRLGQRKLLHRRPDRPEHQRQHLAELLCHRGHQWKLLRRWTHRLER
ncbi:GLUG motif-containing protein [Bradyrhizobium sp. LA2.1]|uniref:GLUG motif-containing protein n=1 Tax=Bradyrhizobium sp. LA2.1 TaxID=3156376 RepID=UPI003394C48A